MFDDDDRNAMISIGKLAKTWGLFIILSLFLVASQTKEKTILFFGDSLTAGYGLNPELSFPSLIQKMIKEEGQSYKVINAGLSGETSAGGLNRIGWVLNQSVDIFVLELGANDGLRGLPLKSTYENLQSIIDKVRDKYPEAKIILAGMMVPPNMGEQYSNEFVNIYPELAQSNDAELIPFLLEGVAGDSELNLADGIHPNAEGHEIVAQNVWKVLEPIL